MSAAHGEARGVHAIIDDSNGFLMRSVDLILSPSPHAVRLWPAAETRVAVADDMTSAPEVPEGYTDRVTLSEDEARAVYLALAEHFGHSGADVAALRRDYDAERARVDRLIGAVIRG